MTNISKHTPGPWEFAGRLGYGYLVDPNICVAYGGIGSGRADDGEANARLIAAAPDLLDIAVLFKRTIEFMIRVDEKNGDAEGANLKRVTLGQVDAAIAIARGEA